MMSEIPKDKMSREKAITVFEAIQNCIEDGIEINSFALADYKEALETIKSLLTTVK